MDSRRNLLNDYWYLLTDSERTEIIHRAMFAIAIKNSKRHWLDVADRPITDRRQVITLGSPRRRATDFLKS